MDTSKFGLKIWNFWPKFRNFDFEREILTESINFGPKIPNYDSKFEILT